ncbi:hypothetical protein BSZ39_06585 [Bowdeniella nasicola]|uniref:TM2 domain-containing protein n=1 Tax=Bowdeniella nasicola TaxID=208480 RepID=A0A1Q5Q2L8_9ACTO|nr:TM2 domain-containing protein [Bowdeniella nasicola]OKL53965.1 hypothetical protein BSZ39_06585 [Bowdeniella nasicola]
MTTPHGQPHHNREPRYRSQTPPPYVNSNADQYPQSGPYQQPYPQQPYPAYAAQKSGVAAGILGILLGALGIHNFYVGRIGLGIAQMLITVLSLGFLAFIPAIWGLIEGILYLVSTEPRWRHDAHGLPLTR